MRMLFRCFLYLLATACLLPSGSAAQEVSGTVRNQQDRPVAEVLLRWIGPSGETAEATTGADGSYRFLCPKARS